MGDVFGLAGQRLDLKYDVSAVVAEGGFGVVYRAAHCSLKRPVAVKVLRVPDGLDGPTRDAWVRQFAQEAKTLARLDHPAVVRVVDFGVSTMPSGARAPWMVLDWIEGRTLAATLAADRRPRAPSEAMALLRPVIAALAAAHAAGVSHRDVKPSNVMCLDAPGEGPAVRLVDFGVARHDEARGAGAPSGETATRSTTSAWSPPYAAPEQVSGTRTGPWTDVHALGLLLTEVLTGRPPYQGDDAMELCAEALAAERPTPARFGVDAGAWEPVLARAVALRPSARFADAGELLAALDAATALEDARAATPEAATALAPAPRRRAPLVLAAAVVVGGGLTIALAAHGPPAPVATRAPPAVTPLAPVAASAPRETPAVVTAPSVSPPTTAPSVAPPVAARPRHLAARHVAPTAESAPSAAPPVAVVTAAPPPPTTPPPTPAPSRVVLAPAE